MMNLVCLMDHILFQTFKIILNALLKKKSSSVQISTSKIKNRIYLKISAGYKLQLLSPETMRLLGSTKKDGDPSCFSLF